MQRLVFRPSLGMVLACVVAGGAVLCASRAVNRRAVAAPEPDRAVADASIS